MLHIAAQKYSGVYSILLFCAVMGLNPRRVDNMKSTALHFAAYGGCKVTVAALLAMGVQAVRGDRVGRTAMDYARARGHRDVASTIMDYVLKRDNSNYSDLMSLKQIAVA